MTFRVRNGTNIKPIPVPAGDVTEEEGPLVAVNHEAMLSEMARMGEGVVRKSRGLDWTDKRMV